MATGEASVTDEAGGPRLTHAQARFTAALTQILVSIVVLNLFVEYVHTVVIDSFTVSIVTAVLLWVMLRVITRLEHRVSGFFRRRKGAASRVLRLLSVWAIMFVSKFVIIEVVGLATAGRAVLGEFFAVVAIVLVLMAAEYALMWVYRRLGAPPTTEGGSAASG
jgi:hypothetical protein